jgi:hypothetical protein
VLAACLEEDWPAPAAPPPPAGLCGAEINPDEYSTASRPLSVSGGAIYASTHPAGLSRWAVSAAG